MICACVKNLFDLHVQGRLVAWEQRRVEAHLSHCARCAAEAQSWRRLFAGLRAVPALAAPPELKAGLRRSLAGRSARPAQRPAAEALAPWAQSVPSLALVLSFAAFLLSVSASILGPGVPMQGCSDSPLSVCAPHTSTVSVIRRSP
ncbi:MAG: zf-HC2 domain-containing protein [Elusimicrobia bacterium]|nr:zf-HC2 domain-containing protein [Elusimicrobiota bacterium]